MKNKLFFSLFSFITIALVGCSSSLKKSEQGTGAFKPRAIEEFQLSNGLRVMMINDKSLPYISYQLVIKTGSTADVAGKLGLANITAELLQKGTQSKSANSIALQFGRFATEFNADVVRDYSAFKVGSISKYNSELLKLFSEVMMEPSFPQSELALLKNQLVSGLAKMSDNASGFSDMLMDEYIFQGHPYGQPVAGRIATVQAISQRDVLAFYRTHYRPDNAILTVVGNFDESMKGLIEARFEKWVAKEAVPQKLEIPRPLEKTQIRIVNKPDVVQTQIRMAQMGVPRNHPDFLKLKVANSILGSGFTSRLVSRVRDQLGLTYHISSQVESLAATGTFEIKTFTKNQTVGQAVRETIMSFQEFQSKGVTDAEVAEAKSFLLGQFPQVVETAEGWMNNILILRLNGVPDTYLTEFNQNVSAITTADVNEVIRKYYHPDKLKIVAFSTADQITDQLKAIAPVEVQDFKQYQ